MKYKIKFASDHTTVVFKGRIDEAVGEALDEVRTQVKTHGLVLDLSGIDLINSIGISTWIAHMGAFDGLDVRYLRAPHNFISLCEMIPVLVRGRRVESFEVRYSCAACADDAVHLGVVNRPETVAAGRFKTMPCPQCKNLMDADPDDDELKVFFGCA